MNNDNSMTIVGIVKEVSCAILSPVSSCFKVYITYNNTKKRKKLPMFFFFHITPIMDHFL